MGDSCCEPKPEPKTSCCPPEVDEHGHSHNKFDLMLWSTSIIVAVACTLHLSGLALPAYGADFTLAAYSLLQKMAIGLLLGIFFVGILTHVPQEYVISVIGKPGKKMSVLRATAAGLLLDLCSHGILMVGMKLYKKGASIGQVMAFLIASPWNSLSLTIILVTLIGLKWTLLFIFFSAVIAIITGFIFDALVARGSLPSNPNTVELHEGFRLMPSLKSDLKKVDWSMALPFRVMRDGLKDSTMIIRWLFLGVILASLIQTFVDTATFQAYFGPTALGLGLTLLAATVIEVCSEGSAPIAADLFTRGGATGNAFTFLMAGVATDYTEIMVLRETTRSWKLTLFLPLLTIPQVLVIAWLMNTYS